MKEEAENVRHHEIESLVAAEGRGRKDKLPSVLKFLRARLQRAFPSVSDNMRYVLSCCNP